MGGDIDKCGSEVDRQLHHSLASLLFSSLCFIHYFLSGCPPPPSLPPRAQAKFRRRRGERRLKHRRRQHKVTQLGNHSNNGGTSQKEARRRLGGERRRRRRQHAVVQQQRWRWDQKETNRRWEDALAQKLTSLLANWAQNVRISAHTRKPFQDGEII